MQNNSNQNSIYSNLDNIRVGVVKSVYGKLITDQLFENLVLESQKYNIPLGSVTLIEVEGAVEIPLILQSMAKSKKFDILITLGCVIRGDTPHFEYVCEMVTSGIMRVMLDESIPIAFGVLTVNTMEQALERVNTSSHALRSAIGQYQLQQYLSKD